MKQRVGSGTTAVCMCKCFKENCSQTIDILQPSGLLITSKVDYEGSTFLKATISGKIETDRIVYELNI